MHSLKVALLLLLTATNAVGMSDVPGEFMDMSVLDGNCTETTQGAFTKETCWVGGEYVPPTSAINQDALDALYGGFMPDDGKQPFTITKRNTTGKKRFTAMSPGHAPIPGWCLNPDLSSNIASASVVLWACPSHWPNQAVWGNGQEPDYAVNFFDGNGERRFRLAAAYAFDKHKDDLDARAGALSYGFSMGSHRAITRMLNMEQEVPRDKQFISDMFTHYYLNVGATQPHNFLPDGRPNIAGQVGSYDMNRVNFDMVAATGKLNNKYIRIECDSGDRRPSCDPAIFHQMDAHGIAGMGTFHGCNTHSVTCDGYDFPYNELYSPGHVSEHRTDKPYVSFSGASSNYIEDSEGQEVPSGHYNLGLSFDIETFFVFDTALVASVIVQYDRSVNIGPDIPDQPVESVTSVVIRNFQDFDLYEGRWVAYSVANANGAHKTGVVQVQEAGEIWVPDVVLPDGEAMAVVLTPGSAPGVSDAQPPIVMTRQPRHQGPPINENIQDAANWQFLTDVGRPNGNTGEGDLVIEYADHSIEMVFNCTTDDSIACLASEARPSPDASKIIFSVSFGTGDLWPVNVEGVPTSLRNFPIVRSELWMYDVATKTKQRLTTGHSDRSAGWINNDRIFFLSSRANVWPPEGADGNYYKFKSYHVWTADIVDNTIVNLVNISSQEQMAFSPDILPDGRICYVSWQGYHEHWFGKTASNIWWPMCVTQNGEDLESMGGAHGSYVMTQDTAVPLQPSNNSNLGGVLLGARGIIAVFLDKFMLVNYYRSNGTGSMGILFEVGDPLGEGALTSATQRCSLTKSTAKGSGRFLPDDWCQVTPGYNAQDTGSPNFDLAGRALGRAGYPAPYNGVSFLYIDAEGWCYVVANAYANEDLMGEHNGVKLKTCKKEVRLGHTIPILDKFDPEQSEPIACLGDEWQCIDARAVRPYSEMFEGQLMPEQHPPLIAGTCEWRIVDAFAHEIFPFSTNPIDALKHQGNGVPDYTPRMVDGGEIVIEQVSHWPVKPPNGTKGVYSKMEILRAKPEIDGSLRLQLPCDTPLTLRGVDKVNLPIATDNMTHNIPPGSKPTCHGCHDGHSTERATELGQTPRERWEGTMAAGKPPHVAAGL